MTVGRSMHRRHQAGFTLLEAIVAMLLISGAGMALFAWINTELGNVAKVQESNERAEAMVNAVEFMHSINPMLRPQGKMVFGTYKIEWLAKEVTAVQDGVSYPQGISLFQLALYDTLVTIRRPDGLLWFDFTLRQVGFKRVRDNKFFM